MPENFGLADFAVAGKQTAAVIDYGLCDVLSSRGNIIIASALAQVDLEHLELPVARVIFYIKIRKSHIADLIKKFYKNIGNFWMIFGYDGCVIAEPFRRVLLKKYVTEAVNEYFAPIRERRQRYENDLNYVKDVLHEGNRRANEIAEQTLAEVQDAMGMVY